jgi:SAM-dependent methyltransferase
VLGLFWGTIRRIFAKRRKPVRDDLSREFDRFEPWVTKFTINGREYGGCFDGMNDARIQEFRNAFPSATRILELGSLEGGHTLGLGSLEGIAEVIGLEGRHSNLAKAEFIKQLFGLQNVTFSRVDLEGEGVLQHFGIFDAVYCCGLLYHLPCPWVLLRQIAEVTRSLFLSTHYCPAEKAEIEQQGYRGMWYGESALHDPLSGLSERSFWPTRECLMAMLQDAGFKQITILHTEEDHPNGPIVTLATQR